MRKWVDVTEGMRSWFAVMMWWNPDLGGFWEPWDTSPLSFATREGAESDGQSWSRDEGVPFGQPPARPPKESE